MSGPIQLILDAQIRSGQEATFQRVCRAVPDLIQKAEPRTLESRWVVQEGGDRVLLMDLYASSSALVQHFQNLQTSGHLDAIRSCLNLVAVHCVGSPDARARLVLGELGTLYYHPVGGFVRDVRPVPLMVAL